MIKIGDKVEVIDDTISGEVTAVSDDAVTIETEDGFPLTYARKEVVKVGELPLNKKAITQAISAKKAGAKAKKQRVSKKRRTEKAFEVDLHIEQLTGSTRNMSDFDMLNLQLHTARGQLEFAIKNHIQRVVFIHGVGKGVLRAELETLLRRYDDQVEFYDADFTKYGRGATEVYIYQNP